MRVLYCNPIFFEYRLPFYKVTILFSALTRMFPKPTFAP